MKYTEIAKKFIHQVEELRNEVDKYEKEMFNQDMRYYDDDNMYVPANKELKIYLLEMQEGSKVYASPALCSRFSDFHIALFIDGNIEHILANTIKKATQFIVKEHFELPSVVSYHVIDDIYLYVRHSPLRNKQDIEDDIEKMLKNKLGIESDFIDAVRCYQKNLLKLESEIVKKRVKKIEFIAELADEDNVDITKESDVYAILDKKAKKDKKEKDFDLF